MLPPRAAEDLALAETIVALSTHADADAPD